MNAERILAWATMVANDWSWLAIVWHVALAASLVAFISGRLRSQRLAAVLIVLPVASVSVIAWVSGNLFNGVAFAILAVVLMKAAVRLPGRVLTYASAGWAVPGVALVAFGWVYPHFLETDTPATYLVAAPFGLLPCPTLSIVIGLTLVFEGFHSRAWTAPVFIAGLLYGLIGAFWLGVALDLWLLAGAKLLGAFIVLDLVRSRVRGHHHERVGNAA